MAIRAIPMVCKHPTGMLSRLVNVFEGKCKANYIKDNSYRNISYAYFYILWETECNQIATILLSTHGITTCI